MLRLRGGLLRVMLRVWPQFRLVFTQVLRMLRVREGMGIPTPMLYHSNPLILGSWFLDLPTVGFPRPSVGLARPLPKFHRSDKREGHKSAPHAMKSIIILLAVMFGSWCQAQTYSIDWF